MNKLRTLIVDDESLARRGLKLRLQKFPRIDIVAECRNGREVLAAVAEHQADLMFLDIQMPGMDGFEVVRRLQDDAMPMGSSSPPSITTRWRPSRCTRSTTC